MIGSRSLVNIRVMQLADLEFCDELRRIAGWNQRREDWARFLRLSPDGCFVAELDGRPAGTVTTVAYGREIAWIGMLLVHPQCRGCGLGSALLKYAVAHLQAKSIRTIKLDATPEGEPLYRRMGFRDEFKITRWQT